VTSRREQALTIAALVLQSQPRFPAATLGRIDGDHAETIREREVRALNVLRRTG
jgi:hypothetical protein